MMLLSPSADNTVVMTLNEYAQGDGGYYLLRLRHRATGEVVSVILDKADDLSPSQDRYNQFTIPADVFANAPAGLWVYSVHEQASSTNTDPTASLRMVEHGWAKLIEAVEAPVQYTGADATYKVYEG